MVRVDDVYQKVLALANKEQRGYITPQEFNLFADMAQMEIFEQYFYDIEQRERGVGNSLDYADIQSGIEEKISIFEEYDQNAGVSGLGTVALSTEVYKLGMVRVRYSLSTQKLVQAEQIQLKELSVQNSPLTASKKSRPVYIMMSSPSGGNRIRVYPHPTVSEQVFTSYIRRPLPPNWTYTIVSGSAMYNGSTLGGLQNFELHPSEESKLVIKILQLAGVAIKDFNLAQLAGQKEASVIQQEKQ